MPLLKQRNIERNKGGNLAVGNNETGQNYISGRGYYELAIS